MRILLIIVMIVLSGGCLRTLDVDIFNGAFHLNWEAEAATSYRVGSYANTKTGAAFDLLYWDSPDPYERKQDKPMEEEEREQPEPTVTDGE